MNRRDFLKYAGKAGLVAAGSMCFPGLNKISEAATKEQKRQELKKELKHKINPLTRKIIELESSWKYWDVGNSFDIGLMQITPIVLEEWNIHNFKKYSEGDLFNPYKNIEVGEWYLYERIGKHYLPYYNLSFTEENKAASYNAGPTLIGKLGDAIENFDMLPKKTQNYLVKLWNLPEVN